MSKQKVDKIPQDPRQIKADGNALSVETMSNIRALFETEEATPPVTPEALSTAKDNSVFTLTEALRAPSPCAAPSEHSHQALLLLQDQITDPRTLGNLETEETPVETSLPSESPQKGGVHRDNVEPEIAQHLAQAIEEAIDEAKLADTQPPGQADPQIYSQPNVLSRFRRFTRYRFAKLKFWAREQYFKLETVTPRHLAVLAILTGVLLEPWALPFFFTLFLVLLGFVWLILGNDRVVDLSNAFWKRYQERHPANAERLRERAMHHRDQAQRWVDRLPESWARHMHLPHWQSAQKAADAESAFATRLRRMGGDSG